MGRFIKLGVDIFLQVVKKTGRSHESQTPAAGVKSLGFGGVSGIWDLASTFVGRIFFPHGLVWFRLARTGEPVKVELRYPAGFRYQDSIEW